MPGFDAVRLSCSALSNGIHTSISVRYALQDISKSAVIFTGLCAALCCLTPPNPVCCTWCAHPERVGLHHQPCTPPSPSSHHSLISSFLHLPSSPSSIGQPCLVSMRSDSEYSGSELIFSYISDPFGFAIKRKSDGQVLFNSSSESKDPYGELVFKDQYLEVSTSFPKDAALNDLGENSQPHGIKLYPNDPYTLFMRFSSRSPQQHLHQYLKAPRGPAMASLSLTAALSSSVYSLVFPRSPPVLHFWFQKPQMFLENGAVWLRGSVLMHPTLMLESTSQNWLRCYDIGGC